MNFNETHFKWYDTIGEIFQHPFVQSSIELYKEDMKNHIPNACYKNIPEWDIIREIFTWELNYEWFLKILRETISKGSEELKDDQYISMLISMILSISQLRDDIPDSPVSIQSLMNEKLMNVINYGKEKKYCFDRDQRIDYSKYEWLRTLITLWFPCIDVLGYIVYFAEWNWNHEIIKVWNEEIWMFYWINMNWEKVEEKDIEKIQDNIQNKNGPHITLVSSTVQEGDKSQDKSHLTPIK